MPRQMRPVQPSRLYLHSHARRRRHLSRSRLVLAIIILFLSSGIVLVVLNLQNKIQGAWPIIVPVVFSASSLIITLSQWLFPVDPNITMVNPSPQIIKPDPPTPNSTTVWRATAIRELFTMLSDADISAIILRGIGGVGKSTLANLFYRYVEEQRLFKDSAFWFSIDIDTKFSEVAETIAMTLKRPFPDFNSLAPQSQPEYLVDLIETSKMERLIVLDFSPPLAGQTVVALADRPGFKEWLKALNDRPSSCRVLFTSRPWSSEDRE